MPCSNLFNELFHHVLPDHPFKIFQTGSATIKHVAMAQKMVAWTHQLSSTSGTNFPNRNDHQRQSTYLFVRPRLYGSIFLQHIGSAKPALGRATAHGRQLEASQPAQEESEQGDGFLRAPRMEQEMYGCSLKKCNIRYIHIHIPIYIYICVCKYIYIYIYRYRMI